MNIWRIIIFLIINFLALGIGGWLAGAGAGSAWYQALNKAPWTPPGWVFGTAWTTIMICFSFYMAAAWQAVSNRNLLLILFGVQWILNVSWNPAFFRFQLVLLALIIIALLTLLVAYFLITYWRDLQWRSLLILPYLLWLLIATSLNAYILFEN